MSGATSACGSGEARLAEGSHSSPSGDLKGTKGSTPAYDPQGRGHRAEADRALDPRGTGDGSLGPNPDSLASGSGPACGMPASKEGTAHVPLFSNRLGCFGWIVVSVVLTLLVLFLLGAI